MQEQTTRQNTAQQKPPSDSGQDAAKRADRVLQSAKRKKAASAFRTISEVADMLDVKQHVLRFWETKFPQIKPLKRGGGRRYYRPEDIAFLQTIHHLLYTEGYTIKGVQKLLKESGKKQVVAAFLDDDQPPPPSTTPNAERSKSRKNLTLEQRDTLESVLDELKTLKRIIKK